MSVQQRIASDVYRMAEKAVTPEQIKSIQAHLVKSVQTGSVPSYVGIPLLNDLNQKMARIQTAPAQAQAMVQQPPVAQQIMGQAEQGVETLPSGLPEEGMAGGGIVAFDDGGQVMSPYQMAEYLLSDEDDDDADYVNAILGDVYNREAGAEDEGIDGLMATTARESVSAKTGNEPARGVTRERTSVSGPAGLESLLKMIEQKESGGRDYDKYGNLLTSPAGAQGRMQVMPGTSRDPGFGIRPAKEGDVEDLARVGREYYTKMLERYGDPKVAAIAYNWGPGNTDNWLKSGAGIDKLPRETRNYVANMREGGIARFAEGDLVGPFKSEADKLRAEARARAAQRAAQRVATPAAPAAPAAPATPSAQGISTLGRLGTGFLGALGLGGYGLSRGAANQLSNMSSDQLEQLEGYGADPSGTSLAAAIMNVRQPSETKAGVATLPTAPAQPRMPVTASNTTGQSYQRTQGAPSPDDRRAAFEAAVGATQDAQDMETTLNLPPAEAAQPTTESPKEEGGIRSILDKFRGDIGKQRDIDNYMSLLSAGLGMMGGTSPFAAANIGQGAQQGVRTYQQAAQLRGADERGLLSGEVALKKYQDLADIRRAQIQGQKGAAQAKAAAGLEAKSAEAIRRYEVQAENDSRMIAEARIKAASKDLINPMSDEQRSAIYADERAKALNKLRTNPVYRKHMQLVVPGYEFDDNSAATQSVLNYDPKTRSLR